MYVVHGKFRVLFWLVMGACYRSRKVMTCTQNDFNVHLYLMSPTQVILEPKAYESETQAYKGDIKVYKSETKAYKSEIKAYEGETKAYKSEIKAYKSETKAYKSEINLYESKSVQK